MVVLETVLKNITTPHFRLFLIICNIYITQINKMESRNGGKLQLKIEISKASMKLVFHVKRFNKPTPIL
jgi:hypothetical protein